MSIYYLPSIKKEFERYKRLGEKTFEQLTDEQLFYQFNKESNSIAIIIKHLRGNMLSRWTDFLTTDGEKEWRNREDEFENNTKNRQDLIHQWNEGWECLFDAIEELSEKELGKHVYIRNEKHSVLEALNRQLTHYAYHIGQIVFIGKTLCGKKWRSLSIPKGQSGAYNRKKFSAPK